MKVMCARYTLRIGAETIKDLFELDEVPEMPPRYNIAPTQDVPVVDESREGERRFHLMRWGLVPHWAKDIKIGVQMINAKSETLAEKSAFRSAFERHRCLIPADGFYEWKDVEDVPVDLFGDPVLAKAKKSKQPYYFTRADGKPFAFAGLWERWNAPEGNVLESCTIITCAPNALVATLHDRMPVILTEPEFDAWLDRSNQDTAALSKMLDALPADEMKMVAVSPVVGNPRNETPECIAPIA